MTGNALFLSNADYANSGYWISKALEAQGWNTRFFSERHSVFNYPERARMIHDDFGPNGEKEERGKAHVAWADWIFVIQSDLPETLGGYKSRSHPERAKWLERMKDKRICLVHGNSYYRQNPDRFTNIWNGRVALTLCYEASLLGKGENEHLLLPPVDPRYFRVPDRTGWRGQVRVGHFPARPREKGTREILPVLEALAANGLCELRLPEFVDGRPGVKRVAWLSQLKRFADCDVVVDQIKPKEANRPLGEWVALATEAAAMGCISIANSRNPEPYVETYGRMPGIHICNTAEDLESELERICVMDRADLIAEQRESRRWIEEEHVLEPTGRMLCRMMADATV